MWQKASNLNRFSQRNAKQETSFIALQRVRQAFASVLYILRRLCNVERSEHQLLNPVSKDRAHILSCIKSSSSSSPAQSHKRPKSSSIAPAAASRKKGLVPVAAPFSIGIRTFAEGDNGVAGDGVICGVDPFPAVGAAARLAASGNGMTHIFSRNRLWRSRSSSMRFRVSLRENSVDTGAVRLRLERVLVVGAMAAVGL